MEESLSFSSRSVSSDLDVLEAVATNSISNRPGANKFRPKANGLQPKKNLKPSTIPIRDVQESLSSIAPVVDGQLPLVDRSFDSNDDLTTRACSLSNDDLLIADEQYEEGVDKEIAPESIHSDVVTEYGMEAIYAKTIRNDSFIFPSGEDVLTELNALDGILTDNSVSRKFQPKNGLRGRRTNCNSLEAADFSIVSAENPPKDSGLNALKNDQTTSARTSMLADSEVPVSHSTELKPTSPESDNLQKIAIVSSSHATSSNLDVLDGMLNDNTNDGKQAKFQPKLAKARGKVRTPSPGLGQPLGMVSESDPAQSNSVKDHDPSLSSQSCDPFDTTLFKSNAPSDKDSGGGDDSPCLEGQSNQPVLFVLEQEDHNDFRNTTVLENVNDPFLNDKVQSNPLESLSLDLNVSDTEVNRNDIQVQDADDHVVTGDGWRIRTCRRQREKRPVLHEPVADIREGNDEELADAVSESFDRSGVDDHESDVDYSPEKASNLGNPAKGGSPYKSRSLKQSGNKRKKGDGGIDQLDKGIDKKFRHSSRRSKRLDPALLDTPEDEIDHRKMVMRDLILLAELKEKRLNKESAATKKSTPSRSMGAADAVGCTSGEETFRDPDENQPEEMVEPSCSKINYHSFMRRTPSERWTKAETELFYKAIRQFGTNFEMIQHLFPGRSRHQVKLKYKAEERKHPSQLADAMTRRSEDHTHFQLVIERLQAQAETSSKHSESSDHDGQKDDAQSDHQPEQQNRPMDEEIDDTVDYSNQELHPLHDHAAKDEFSL